MSINRILTVTQLNEYVSGMMSFDPILSNVQLQGEASNVRHVSSGHVYFSLKDEQSLIRCVLFQSHASEQSDQLHDGMSVVVSGYVSIYARDGQYQCYVKTIEQYGLGELYQQFEARKTELAALGYFDAVNKHIIPKLPRCIGIVTSITGAVVHDIRDIVARRCPLIPVLVCPSSVQGERAADEICQAIAVLDAIEDVDVIILARGGGSFEDLWPFNTDEVAMAIAQCNTPLISAVGHETDVTIADFVADLRAPTPSAAAELATPAPNDLFDQLCGWRAEISNQCKRQIKQKTQQLNEYYFRLLMKQPKRNIDKQKQILDAYRIRLSLVIKQKLQSFQAKQELLYEQMLANDPKRILKQGYAWIHQNHRPIHSVQDVSVSDLVEIMLQDGRIIAAVIEKESSNEKPS